VSAHADQTLLELQSLPIPRVVPFGLRRDRLVLLSLSSLLLALTLAAASPRVRHGLNALIHPSPLDARGARIGAVVQQLALRLHYPAYLARADGTLTDASEFQVPRGTTVELTIDTRIDADALELSVANVALPLAAVSARQFRGSFVARDSGTIEIRLHEAERWLRDRTPRSIITLTDSAPTIELVAPGDGTVIAPDAAFGLGYRASDDSGLMTVELVISAPGGREVRRRLWTSIGNAAPQVALSEEVTLLASELMAKPGDTVALWLEATDRSAFDGPNRSRSAKVRVEIASDAGNKLELRNALRDVLDRALDALAERLEHGPGVDDAAAMQRHRNVSRVTGSLVDSLETWVQTARASSVIARGDQSAMVSMRTRHRHMLTEEQGLHGPRLAALTQRTAVDRRAIADLERDALFVSDLLGRAHLAEAEALAAELAQIRQQLTDLMKRMESSDDPEARKEMMTAIARAQERLARLMQSLAALADHVPGEFVNADALRSKSADNALSAMAKAMQDNDLKTAEQKLADLTREVDELQQALRDGTLSFTQDRFGERNQAMEAARSELAALSEEQQRLAQRSGQMLQRLGERWSAQHGADAHTEGLQAKARAAREALDGIDRSALGGMEAQALDRVSQRLSDTSSALESGDLRGADQMAGLAADSAEELERDLDIMRRMFPGARGETARNADRARRARSAIDGLRSSIGQRAPDVTSAMNEADGRELRADADPQQNVRNGTNRLAQSLEGGPDGSNGTPLHQEGAHGLRAAERAMQRAEQALRRGDPESAATDQTAAGEALEAAREAMQEQNGGERGGGDRSGGGDPSHGHVRIPAERSTAAQALRKKLIEGMRDARPRGYESAVERYYRELLE